MISTATRAAHTTADKMRKTIFRAIFSLSISFPFRFLQPLGVQKFSSPSTVQHSKEDVRARARMPIWNWRKSETKMWLNRSGIVLNEYFSSFTTNWFVFTALEWIVVLGSSAAGLWAYRLHLSVRNILIGFFIIYFVQKFQEYYLPMWDFPDERSRERCNTVIFNSP